MIRGENLPMEREQSQTTVTFKDFAMGERIKKVTTHDLFQLTKNDRVYVAKLFQPQFHYSYLHELNVLRQLDHENIVSLVYNQPAETESMGLWSCDMLILESAEHGSLDEYIPINGRLPESIARVLFKQMLSGLKYAACKEPNGIIHPNLQPSSILLDSQRKVKICGWSKQNEKKDKKDQIKDLLFCCCEILILMITGYMPFFKKDAKVDPLYRYVRPDYIDKFWQIFEKRITSKHKSLMFSKSFKELIQKVFLEEWTSFQQIEQCAWVNEQTPTRKEFTAFLQSLQSEAKQRRQTSIQRQLQKFQQKRKLIFEYELDTVQGSSNRSSGEFDFFIQDFYDHFYSKQDVPASQCSELIRVFDQRPSFVIATIKEKLRCLEEENNQEKEFDFIFGGEFKLQNYEIERAENEIYLKLQFAEVHEDLLDPEEDVEIKIKSLIKFFKNNNNHLYAEVKILESNLSEFYATRMMKFIEDTVRGYEEQ